MKNKITVFRILAQTIYVALFIASVLSKNLTATIAIVSAVLLGPIFCGWMCPFGFFQDFMRYIGKLIKKDPIEIDYKIHKYLRFSRYLFLILVTFVGGVFLFPGEMKHSLFGLLKGHLVVDIALFAVIALGILSLFTKRFYCRYLCSFGAKLGLWSLLRVFTIKRDAEKCVNCKTCSRECPMHINVHEVNNLANPNCVNCFRCIENCPKKCLKFGIRNYFRP